MMVLLDALGCYCLGAMLLMAGLILHEWPRAWRKWDRFVPGPMRTRAWLLFFITALILASPVMLPKCMFEELREKLGKGGRG